MRINIRLKNEQRVEAKFGKRMNNTVKAVMKKKGEQVGKMLVRYVRSQKLRGQYYRRRSGDLANSVRAVVKATQTYVRIKLEAATPYAKILHDGGRIPPHVINARGKALAFRLKARGKVMFAKSVNHPGANFKGKPFLADSMKELTPKMNTELKEALVKALS